MVHVQRGLEGNDVPNGAEVMSVISPPHPRYEGTRLKAGLDENGAWWYFEQACCGGNHCGSWRKYRKCNSRQAQKLAAFDEANLLTHEPDEGPEGCELVYSKFV